MKIKALFSIMILAIAAFGQSAPAKPAASAFSDATINFGLTPIELPKLGETLSGAVTETTVNVTQNNGIGEMTLISSSPFIAGEYQRTFPSVSKWLQNHTNFSGANFQVGLKAQFGIVKASTDHYGEGAAFFLNYAPSGSSNFGLGAQIGWMNLPGVAHNIPAIAVGPSFHF